jgi:predicted phosphodiesterase
MYRLRILHISDLHERGSREKDPWRTRRVLGEAWDRNLAELLQDGPFDLVFFTGDAAFSGRADEYEAAGGFLVSLCERLRVSRERLFLAPGNHDVDRTRQEEAWRRMRMALRAGVSRQGVSRWMAGKSDPPLGIEAAWRDQILERQAAYRNWVRDRLGRPQLAVPLAYRVAVEIPGLAAPIHVLGLNSAWLSGDDADPKNLLLTENQLMDAATESGRRLNGLRLLLMHHPFDELADGAECRRLLADHVDFVFRGHLHEPTVETWADPDRKVRQVAAGCLYESDHYPNSCQALTLTLDGQGRPLRADLHFRSWSKRGHWFDDDSLYRDSRQGRLAWAFETPRPVRAPNPYDPWTPRPETFFGRAEALRRLEEAALNNRSVSIVADWRMGKSLLLQVWKQRLGNMGRTAVLVSGEGREGTSVAAFVQAITGLSAPDDADAAADLLSDWAAAVGSKGQPPVILVDETGSLIRPLGVRFLERLRGMLGRIALVLASRQDLAQTHEEAGVVSPWNNRLEVVWLGLLEAEAAEELIGLGAAAHAGLMRQWAGRHPFFLQLLGHFLVDADRSGRPPASALEQFRVQAAPRLWELWSVLASKEKEDLRRTLTGVAVNRLTLRSRGLLTDDGRPFGEVLTAWMREEA